MEFKELNKDIVMVLEETCDYILATVKEVSADSNLVVISKHTGERTFVTSLEEAAVIAANCNKITERDRLYNIERAKLLLSKLERTLNREDLEYNPALYKDYESIEREGEPCVKVIISDGTVVTLGCDTLKYKHLMNMKFKETEILSIAKVLSEFYGRDIAVIKNGEDVVKFNNAGRNASF